jgi:hypothetical protein
MNDEIREAARGVVWHAKNVLSTDKVNWCVDDDADTIEDVYTLYRHFSDHGFIPISAKNSESTVFSSPEDNYAVRAWHDWAHIRGMYPFNIGGEARSMALQMADIVRLCGNSDTHKHTFRLLWIEVMGQIMHKELHGVFPKDQVTFTEDMWKVAGRIY